MGNKQDTTKQQTSQILPPGASGGFYTPPSSSGGILLTSQAPPEVTPWGICGKGAAGGNSPADIPKNLPDAPGLGDSLAFQCGHLIIITQCEGDKHHTFAKLITCGREWCPVCGQNGSPAHNRRIARLLPKVQQINSQGYLVIEWPKRYRLIPGFCHSKTAIQITTNLIVEVLAGRRKGRRGRVAGYFKRGLLRWHWFGDDNPGKWNPHCNIIVDSGYIEGTKLAEIQEALRKTLKVPDLIVHYSYAEAPAAKYHQLKYITRATFLDYTWDGYMAGQLYGFRNIRWWGNWKDAPVWGVKEVPEVADLSLVNMIHAGFCPDCGAALHKWSRPIDSAYLVIFGAKEIGGTGYYRLLPQDWPTGSILSPGDIMRLETVKGKGGQRRKCNLYSVLSQISDKPARVRPSIPAPWWGDDDYDAIQT